MSYVAWMLESTVNDRAALDAVKADLVAAVESNEPGTTHYEWSLSADARAFSTTIASRTQTSSTVISVRLATS